MKLMIVESPNKVKKISSILGSGWTVAASVGHIRDLPEHEAGVSAPDFRPKYQVTDQGKGVVAKLKTLAARADSVYLATDPDREGEAIAWHIAEVLQLRNALRVTFNSITAKAITEALSYPRSIDLNLVRAQEARRVLDRLVGFTISPVLGHMLQEHASAGRVQTPAVRLIVEREREISTFKPIHHFLARLHFDNGRWTAGWITKPFLNMDEKYVLDEELARKAAAIKTLTVAKCEQKDVAKPPPPAFTTSTLLQAASAQLHLKPNQTAKLSQALFEQGLITYHRTDSQNLSEEAVAEIREYATQQKLPLPEEPRKWNSRQDAQEAHEAIRPTHFDIEQAGASVDEQALYDLIRKRALASQLADAVYSNAMLGLEGQFEGVTFHYSARASLLKVKGWRAVTFQDAVDENENQDEDHGNVPQHPIGTIVTADKGDVVAKVTEAPSRYSQAGLIKKLEKLGIGRPSTYASTITNIMARGYIEEHENQVHPADKALRAIDAMNGKFAFLQYDFTRDVEFQLDQVAHGKATYLDVVRNVDGQMQSELGRIGADLPEITVPTAPQLQFAHRLAEKLNEQIPAEILSNRTRLGEWLTDATSRSDKAFQERMRAEPASDAQMGVIERAVSAGRLEAPIGWPTIDKFSASQLIEKIVEKRKGSFRISGTRRRH